MISRKHREQAKKILNRILKNPAIADQYTEEEIEQLEFIALDQKDIGTTPCGEEQPYR